MPHLDLGQALTAAFAATILFVAAPGDVCAQTVDVSNRSATLSAASVSVTSTIVGGVIVSVMVDVGNTGLQHYLEHNAVAVMGDISRGGGPTVEDLADVFGVSQTDRREFARLLFAQRRALLPLLRRIRPTTGEEFVAAVLSR